MQSESALLSSVACPALQNFFTLSDKRHDFRGGGVILHNTCVWIFSENFVRNVSILNRNEQNMIINVYWSPSKVPFILWDFNETWIILTDFRKIIKHRILWKTVRWESSCCMRTDGQRDVAILIVTFHDYANALKSCYLLRYLLNETVVNCEWQNEWKMNLKKKFGRKQMCGLI